MLSYREGNVICLAPYASANYIRNQQLFHAQNVRRMTGNIAFLVMHGPVILSYPFLVVQTTQKLSIISVVLNNTFPFIYQGFIWKEVPVFPPCRSVKTSERGFILFEGFT